MTLITIEVAFLNTLSCVINFVLSGEGIIAIYVCKTWYVNLN